MLIFENGNCNSTLILWWIKWILKNIRRNASSESIVHLWTECLLKIWDRLVAIWKTLWSSTIHQHLICYNQSVVYQLSLGMTTQMIRLCMSTYQCLLNFQRLMMSESVSLTLFITIQLTWQWLWMFASRSVSTMKSKKPRNRLKLNEQPGSSSNLSQVPKEYRIQWHKNQTKMVSLATMLQVKLE